VIFKFFILFSGIGGSGVIDGNGVINNQIDGADGVDLIGITTKSLDGISHGSEIADSGDTSEILKKDSGGEERNIQILVAGVFPVEDSFNISGLELEFVAVSDGAFEEDSDTVREFFNSSVLKVGKGIVLVAIASDSEGLLDGVVRVGLSRREVSNEVAIHV